MKSNESIFDREQKLKHSVQYSLVEFDRDYVTQCRKCSQVLFDLNYVDSLVKWNSKYMLMLKQQEQPASFFISKNRIIAEEGPFKNNIFYHVTCFCQEVIGIKVLYPFITTKLFEGRILVDARKIKVTQLINDSGAGEFHILAAFEGEGFIKYSPSSLTSVQQQASHQDTLKRKSHQKSQEESQREQIKESMLYFAKVLMDLDKRIEHVQVASQKIKQAVQKFIPLFIGDSKQQ